ncbi:Ig-like domain-containing protein [Moorena bouillonii]|uniref:SbsA Ig-like domain-containing protein n=1 Tax=Moorena bouillonii PNG TaxID=568701 RepID=A0A1U7N7G3_9CYAN|nr:Ig-like domain-containing protein [Moorena bouillonii]OLT61887.1 hypothetical protein BJP37_25525 [Moorena bouillonii PNG]
MKIQTFLQPIDRTAGVVIVILSLLIGILLWTGDRTAPRVREFSWQDKQIGAEDKAFILTFSRPMDQTSVEANLNIVPPIPGKISWAGRKMAYTPLLPLPYGTEYQFQLTGAVEQFAKPGNKTAIEPFKASFRTRDRAFAYVGVKAEEQGRLIFYNLTRQQKTILTPPDLLVMDFKFYPDGSRILFSAVRSQNKEQDLLSAKLYTVTTGISTRAPAQETVSSDSGGKVELVLDSKDYQNLKFDLSADGKTIVVQRVSRSNPSEFGLWTIQTGTKPKPLDHEPGGDFIITPDSNAIAMAQGQGVGILPLTPNAQPLDFLPKFGMVLNFAKDGSAAVMVKFNSDYTRSLFLVKNQGSEQEILRTTGSVHSCEFSAQNQILYCLLSQLIAGEEFKEEPFLAAISLKPNDKNEYTLKRLVLLPEQQEVHMSLSPDDLGILFDQIVPERSSDEGLITDEGQIIANARLWLLPLVDDTSSDTPVKLEAEPLLTGFNARWLP